MNARIDCILVRPSEGRGYYLLRENLGVAYITAFLRRAGLRAEILDASIDGLTVEQVVTRILEAAPAVVGFSVMHFEALNECRAISSALRAAGYRGHMTMGQHFATFNAERILRDAPEIDSIVRFEGEETALELVEAVRQRAPLDGILGLSFRGTDGKVVNKPPRPLIADLDRLPFPVRDVVARNPDRLMTLNISASRGCPWRCKFCTIATFYRIPQGRIWRHRSPKNVVDEMESVVKQYGSSRPFFFVDDQFMGSGHEGREFARSLAREILARRLDVTFGIETRADTIDRESIELLKRAGLYLVFVGVESGYQPTLDFYQKDITVGQNLAAVKLLQQLDLDVQMGFIMFHERTTLAEVNANLDFLERTDAFEAIPFFNELKVHAGTTFMSERGEQCLTEEYESPWEMADHQAREYQRQLETVLLPLIVPANTLTIARRTGGMPRSVSKPFEQRIRAAFLRIARRLLSAAQRGGVSASVMEDLSISSETEAGQLQLQLTMEMGDVEQQTDQVAAKV